MTSITMSKTNFQEIRDKLELVDTLISITLPHASRELAMIRGILQAVAKQNIDTKKDSS